MYVGNDILIKSFVEELKQIYKEEGSLFVGRENQIWNNANELEWNALNTSIGLSVQSDVAISYLNFF